VKSNDFEGRERRWKKIHNLFLDIFRLKLDGEEQKDRGGAGKATTKIITPTHTGLGA
jgi:hypothetical protein